MLFKNKKKDAVINIQANNDSVTFNISWDKTNYRQISLLVNLLVMLNNGGLQSHIEKAIEHYGKISKDEETAIQILLAVKGVDEQVSRKHLENKYLNQILSCNQRNPVIQPDQVLNNFRNSINS